MPAKRDKPEDVPKPELTDGLEELLPSVSTPVLAHQGAIEDSFTDGGALRFGFIGAGQMGGRLAQSFYELGYRRVAVINTTSQDFEGLSPEIAKCDLKISGAFKEPEIAAREIASREEEVWDLLHQSMGTRVDCILVCAGLGGGTGTGLSPYVLKIAGEYLQSVGSQKWAGGVFSLPMPAEGRKLAVNAARGLEQILKLGASPVFLIDNSRIHELQQRPAMSQMYSLSNALVSKTLHKFNLLAARRSSFITFDRSEFADVLRQGIVTMGMANLGNPDLKHPGELGTLIGNMLADNMLCRLPLNSAKRAACVFVAADSLLERYSIDFFSPAFEKMERMLQKSADSVVHRGIYPLPTTGLSCYTLVGGLQPPADLLQKVAAGVGPSKAEFFGI